MVKQPKNLTWNADQIEMYNLLQQGQSVADVAAAMKMSTSTVTKVANAIKKGQSPDSVKPSSQNIVPPNDTPGKQTDKKPGSNITSSSSISGIPKSDISQLLLKPVPEACPITPIMINARYTAITEFNFPQDISWQDFFDTCLVHLFHYWGYGLQGVYKLDEKERGLPPKPASGNGGGGNGQSPQVTMEEQAKKLGMVMIEIMGGVNNTGSPQSSAHKS